MLRFFKTSSRNIFDKISFRYPQDLNIFWERNKEKGKEAAKESRKIERGKEGGRGKSTYYEYARKSTVV